MFTVKIDTSPWILSQEEFNFYTPNNDGIYKNYKFEINNNCNVCDYWIIRGGINKNYDTVYCPEENIIFLLDEVYDREIYSNGFLNQFAAVIGPKKEIIHNNYIHNHEIIPWLFYKKKYNYLRLSSNRINKSKLICLMTSDAVWQEGHKNRFAFSNQLIGHFKKYIDVYGRGFNSFDCKYEILKNYKYCICLENSAYPDYFTEKINECFLSDSFPIYYGCPNIFDYYDKNSIAQIELSNLENSITEIENSISQNKFEHNYELLLLQKEKYFNYYHFPNNLISIIENKFQTHSKRKNRILSHRFYFNNKESFNLIKKGGAMFFFHSFRKML